MLVLLLANEAAADTGGTTAPMGTSIALDGMTALSQLERMRLARSIHGVKHTMRDHDHAIG